MSAATRIPLHDAELIAEELAAVLEDCCERLEICGSIRRRTATVGDLDLVAISKTEPIHDPMFGEPTGHVLDLLDARCDELLAEGILGQRLDAAGRARWGVNGKRMIYRGLNVDLNTCDPTTLGVWLAIRTGPGILSHRLVTPRSERIFLAGVEYQKRPHGLLPPGFEFPKGAGFALHRFGGRIETPEETDFFAAIGLPFVAPENRR